MKCPNCQHNVEDSNAEACPACGAVLTSELRSWSDAASPTRTSSWAIAEEHLASVCIRVEVIEGPDRGKTAQSDTGRLILGTSDSAGLQLTDRSVSREHAELLGSADGALVIDLGSKNGTQFDGSHIARALIPQNGVIQLGASTRVRVTPLLDEPSSGSDAAGQILEYVTASPEVKRSLELLRCVAPTDTTVLIEGETGTGKGLLAKALHDRSERSDGPFVVVDCGAISNTLMESQLFGHKRGAFTGAQESHTGAFEAAKGGTVFLDEIGELPLDLQPKLLRALESRTINRLGEVEHRSVDVRFVAATNRALTEMVEAGTFRSDLYYRIAVVRVELPPLRERPEDVSILATHFATQLSGGTATVRPEVVELLEQYDWPGNARELRNVLHRAIVVSRTGRIGTNDLFPAVEEAPSSFTEAKNKVIAEFERRYASTLLKRNAGNITKAARDAGLSRPAIYALLKRAGLES